MTASSEGGAGSIGAFDRSRATFDALVVRLEGGEAGELAHSELDERLQVEGRELLRQLFQDHLDLRADREQPLAAVAGADGVQRRTVEAARGRALASVFGELSVARIA